MAKARRNKLPLKKEDDDQRDMFTMPKTFLDALSIIFSAD